MTGYKIVHIRELVKALGEDEAQQILSSFSCPLNEDVETFIRRKALLFSRQGWAQTNLVFASYKENPVLVGYFSLANKFITVQAKAVRGEVKRRLGKHATYDEHLRSFHLAVPLIAQLGKNFHNGYNKLISGDELMGMACERIKGIQYDLGGRFAYLECEDKPQLIQFYKRHGFTEFDRRSLDPDETGLFGTYLIQMLRMFRGSEST